MQRPSDVSMERCRRLSSQTLPFSLCVPPCSSSLGETHVGNSSQGVCCVLSPTMLSQVLYVRNPCDLGTQLIAIIQNKIPGTVNNINSETKNN